MAPAALNRLYSFTSPKPFEYSSHSHVWAVVGAGHWGLVVFRVWGLHLWSCLLPSRFVIRRPSFLELSPCLAVWKPGGHSKFLLYYTGWIIARTPTAHIPASSKDCSLAVGLFASLDSARRGTSCEQSKATPWPRRRGTVPLAYSRRPNLMKQPLVPIEDCTLKWIPSQWFRNQVATLPTKRQPAM